MIQARAVLANKEFLSVGFKTERMADDQTILPTLRPPIKLIGTVTLAIICYVDMVQS